MATESKLRPKESKDSTTRVQLQPHVWRHWFIAAPYIILLFSKRRIRLHADLWRPYFIRYVTWNAFQTYRKVTTCTYKKKTRFISLLFQRATGRTPVEICRSLRLRLLPVWKNHKHDRIGATKPPPPCTAFNELFDSSSNGNNFLHKCPAQQRHSLQRDGFRHSLQSDGNTITTLAAGSLKCDGEPQVLAPINTRNAFSHTATAHMNTNMCSERPKRYLKFFQQSLKTQ